MVNVHHHSVAAEYGPGLVVNHSPEATLFTWQRIHSSAAWRYSTPVVLSLATAALAAIAAVNKGPVRVYWTLGFLALTALNTLLSSLKEKGSVAAKEAAVDARAKLATAIIDGGQTLTAALADAAMTQSPDERVTAVSRLLDRVVGLASTELGKHGEQRSRTRGVYYHLNGNRLERALFQGRAGSSTPRPVFEGGRSDHDDLALKVARGEDAFFVSDLRDRPPDAFSDAERRSYVSFVSVPVKAGYRNYGMLTADSDARLLEVDKEMLILLARLLAIGFAMLDETGITAVVKRGEKSGFTKTVPDGLPGASQIPQKNYLPKNGGA